MADSALREIERDAAQGDPEAVLRLWNERKRLGLVDPLPWWVDDRDWLVIAVHAESGRHAVITAFYIEERARINAEKSSKLRTRHHNWTVIERDLWPRESNGRA